MPTYTKETALYDTGAIAADIQDAGSKATGYMTDVSNDGVFVHEYSATDVTPSTTGANGVHISDDVDIVRNGEVVASYGTDAVIGANANGKSRTEIKSTGIDFIRNNNGTDVPLAHIGYDTGNSESGTATAPYYSFGSRRSGSAIGIYSMAEGSFTVASSAYSHAEGQNTTAGANSAHSEGAGAFASGAYSHAQNLGTIASSESQTAIGKYNIEDSNNNYALIIGNGTIDYDHWDSRTNFYDGTRSNALTVDWDGNITCGNHGSAIGNVVSGNATKSLANSTNMTKLADLRTLGAGTWIVNAGVRFTGHATGTRAIQIYVDGTGDGPGFASGNVAGNGLFSLECSSIVSSNSDMPIALYARQNSGAAMSVTYYWSAVRIV